MRYLLIILLFLSVTAVFAQNLHTLQLKPITFSEETPLMPSGVFQIEVEDDHIYTRFTKDPYVTVLNHQGQVVDNFGRAGAGPEELGRGLISMSAKDRDMWIVSMSRRLYAKHYVDGEYVGDLHLKSDALSSTSVSVNRFDFNDDVLVYPAAPWDGCLAFAYDLTGVQDPKPIGKLLFDQTDEDVLKVNPAINDTYWSFDGEVWIATFRFFPLIQIYDQSFSLIDQIELSEIPQIEERYEEAMDIMASSNKRRGYRFLFSDVTVTKDFIWLMGKSALFRINRQTKDLSDLYYFRLSDQIEFEHLIDRQANLNLLWFGLVGQNKIFLSGVQRWGQDLLYVDLPNPKGIAGN